MATAERETFAPPSEVAPDASPLQPPPSDLLPTMGLLKLAAVSFVISINLYGSESLIQGAGPILAIVGLIIVPIFWMMPYVQMVAELSCAVPTRAGAVMWVNVTCPAWCTYAVALWTVMLNVCDMAIAVVSFTTYLQAAFPHEFGPNGTAGLHVLPMLRVGIVLSCIGMNLAGADTAGFMAILASVASSAPFLLLFVMQLPSGLNWERISYVPPSLGWTLVLVTAGSFFSGLENCGTIVGSITDPQRTIIRALVATVAIGVAVISVGILGASSNGLVDAVPPAARWGNGFFYVASSYVGGHFLGIVFLIGLTANVVGYQVSCALTASNGLVGMSEMRVFPRRMSKWLAKTQVGTDVPLRALVVLSLLSSFVAVNMEFRAVMFLDQLLYCVRLLAIVISFVRMRSLHPTLERPFRAFSRGGRSIAPQADAPPPLVDNFSFQHNRLAWAAVASVTFFTCMTIIQVAATADGALFAAVMFCVCFPLAFAALVVLVLRRGAFFSHSGLLGEILVPRHAPDHVVELVAATGNNTRRHTSSSDDDEEGAELNLGPSPAPAGGVLVSSSMPVASAAAQQPSAAAAVLTSPVVISRGQ